MWRHNAQCCWCIYMHMGVCSTVSEFIVVHYVPNNQVRSHWPYVNVVMCFHSRLWLFLLSYPYCWRDVELPRPTSSLSDVLDPLLMLSRFWISAIYACKFLLFTAASEQLWSSQGALLNPYKIASSAICLQKNHLSCNERFSVNSSMLILGLWRHYQL